MEEVERTLVRFLKDYAASSGRDKAVVGLSGGVDSAVSAALAARSFGAENVHALVLPSASSPQEDLDDAADVAQWLGIDVRTVSIQPLLDALDHADPGFSREGLGNSAARIRMILLFEEARRLGGLVVGTGNKSEVLVGYFTKFGDGGVDVQPLADLYKTQVFALAEHVGIPQRVRDKAPSARLWAGQTDEAELGMPYATLDRVLLGLEVRLDAKLIAQTVGVTEEAVERIARMWAVSQHKRRMPMVPKFGMRTPGIDWRDATLR